MKRPNVGAMCSIPHSWAKLLIRLGSQWIVCSGRLTEFRPKSRRNWPPHAGHSSDPLSELCRFWLGVCGNKLWCVPVSCNNCRFGSPETSFGCVDLSAVGKNFLLGCSVGRPNLVLRRLCLLSLLQKTSFELLRSRLCSWLRSTSRLWQKFPMKRGYYSWASLLLIHPRLSSPEPRSGSLDFCTRSGVSGPNQILSSANCRGAGSDISLSRRLSSHKCLRVSSIVRRISNRIALWSTPTPTSASESWRERFCLASVIRSVCILLEDFRSRSDLSDPWLWDSLTSASSRSWSSIRRISLDPSQMSCMLMQWVSVCDVRSWLRTVVGCNRLVHPISF
mgnify:CR=1 FL=1